MWFQRGAGARVTIVPHRCLPALYCLAYPRQENSAPSWLYKGADCEESVTMSTGPGRCSLSFSTTSQCQCEIQVQYGTAGSLRGQSSLTPSSLAFQATERPARLTQQRAATSRSSTGPCTYVDPVEAGRQTFALVLFDGCGSETKNNWNLECFAVVCRHEFCKSGSPIGMKFTML